MLLDMTEKTKKKTRKARQLSFKALSLMLLGFIFFIIFLASILNEKRAAPVVNAGHKIEPAAPPAVALAPVRTIPESIAPPIVEKKESVFKIIPPSVDSLVLGQQKTVEEFAKMGYLTEATYNSGFMAFKETKYNLFDQVASITFEAQNNIINKMTVQFEAADNQKLINTIQNAYSFDKKYCSGLNCNVLIQGDRVNMTLFTTSGIATIVYILK